MSYVEGTVVRFTTDVAFTNISGAAADPTEVIFAYRIARGTPVQIKYTGTGSGNGVVIKDSVGIYHVDIDTTGLPGTWEWSWVGISTSPAPQVRFDGETMINPAVFAVTP